MPTVFNVFYVTRPCWINYFSLSLEDDQNVIVIQTHVIIDAFFNYEGIYYTNCKFYQKVKFLNGNYVLTSSNSFFARFFAVFCRILTKKGSKKSVKNRWHLFQLQNIK